MEKELVFIGENGEAVTDSNKVAEVFGKRNRDVLRDIRNLDCSQEFHERNFALCLETKKLQVGSTQTKHYTMTKDGFTFLVMGYTGAKAAKFKEAYIAEFNRMERALRERKVKHQFPDIDVSKYGRKELADMILESDAELGEALVKLEEKTGEIAVLRYRIEKKDEEIRRLHEERECRPVITKVNKTSTEENIPSDIEAMEAIVTERLEKKFSERMAEIERRIDCLSRINALEEWRMKKTRKQEYSEEFFKTHPNYILISYPIPTPGEVYQAMTLDDVRQRLWADLYIQISPKSLIDFLEKIGFIESSEKIKYCPTNAAVDRALLLPPLATKTDDNGIEICNPKFTERGFLRIVEIIREEGFDL